MSPEATLECRKVVNRAVWDSRGDRPVCIRRCSGEYWLCAQRSEGGWYTLRLPTDDDVWKIAQAVQHGTAIEAPTIAGPALRFDMFYALATRAVDFPP